MRILLSIFVGLLTWVVLGVATALLLPLVGRLLPLQLPYQLLGAVFSLVALLLGVVAAVAFYRRR